ncbi:hypothetical protein ACLKA6_006700 [Drosophila palustris]
MPQYVNDNQPPLPPLPIQSKPLLAKCTLVAAATRIDSIRSSRFPFCPKGASIKPGNNAAASLTSRNYNLMVFTCKLFSVGEPVGGNNFINYVLDMAAWSPSLSPAQVRPKSRATLATAGVSPFEANINLFYFLLRPQVN